MSRQGMASGNIPPGSTGAGFAGRGGSFAPPRSRAAALVLALALAAFAFAGAADAAGLGEEGIPSLVHTPQAGRLPLLGIADGEEPDGALEDAINELREDLRLKSGEALKEYRLSSMSSYDYKEEESVFKRRARSRGVRLRTLYGPQAGYMGSLINSEDEEGTRQSLGLTLPINEIWEAAFFDQLSFFSLRDGGGSAGREAVQIRVGKNPAHSFRPWASLTPYTNFADAKGQAIAVAAGAEKTWRNGTYLAGEVYAWRPWDEGYSTIVEDGRRHGGAVSLTLPFTDRLGLTTRGTYEELELGEGAKSGAQYAGSRYTVNSRLYYRLIQRKGAYMDYGFRDDLLWNEYLVGCEITPFVQVDFQRYHKPDGFRALNPVTEVFGQEAGLAFQYAFSPHLGVTGEGFIGRDPDRDLAFGELYGLSGRLWIVVDPHLRLWVGASYTKTNPSLESSGGRENIVSLGINYAF